MVIDVQNAEGFPMHLERYPGATVALLDAQGRLAEGLTREWLDGLDVVFSCETLYDWRLAAWAREQHVATVVQVNPEFYLHGQHPELPPPSMWWNPTSWRMEHLPAGARVVPVPVALDRFPNGVWPTRNSETTGPLRALHVVGRRAVADRNGTELLSRAMRRVRGVELTVKEQRPADGMGEADYWRLYDGFDVLVLPRRFGGLCLPVQEAMAAGLAVVMPACPPNLDWPIVPVRFAWKGHLPVPCGTIPLADTDVQDLAGTLGFLGAHPDQLAGHQARSVRWAEEHSWKALLPLYHAELELAVEGTVRA